MLNYTDYIKLILFISFWCVGLYLAAEEGMLLYRFKLFLNNCVTWTAHLFTKDQEIIFACRDKIVKPLIGCPYCMSSVHTIGILLVYSFIFNIHHGWLWILIWLSLAVPAIALNGLVFETIDFLRTYVKALKNDSEEIITEAAPKSELKGNASYTYYR